MYEKFIIAHVSFFLSVFFVFVVCHRPLCIFLSGKFFSPFLPVRIAINLVICPKICHYRQMSQIVANFYQIYCSNADCETFYKSILQNTELFTNFVCKKSFNFTQLALLHLSMESQILFIIIDDA